LILDWLGKPPRSVHASLENRQYGDLPVEDTAKIKLEFEQAGGASLTAEIFLTWASRVRKNAGVIEGNSGRIQIEDDHLSVFQKNGSGRPPEIYHFDSPLSRGSHHPDWFDSVIEEFRREIADPEARGKNLRAAKACLRLVETSKESHLKGEQVPFE
jgi:predicted dehydrogenase